MKSEFLETGEIVNTHGVRGEMKITPWADSPGFLCQFDTLYVDGKPMKVLSSRVHKTAVLCTLEGVDTVEKAMKLKGKVVSLRRDQIQLPEGYHFLVDLVGLKVMDAASGEELGTVAEVLTFPAHNVYVVRGKGREYMIPAVPAFIVETNEDEGFIKVNVIEGMGE